MLPVIVLAACRSDPPIATSVTPRRARSLPRAARRLSRAERPPPAIRALVHRRAARSTRRTCYLLPPPRTRTSRDAPGVSPRRRSSDGRERAAEDRAERGENAATRAGAAAIRSAWDARHRAGRGARLVRVADRSRDARQARARDPRAARPIEGESSSRSQAHPSRRRTSPALRTGAYFLTALAAPRRSRCARHALRRLRRMSGGAAAAPRRGGRAQPCRSTSDTARTIPRRRTTEAARHGARSGEVADARRGASVRSRRARRLHRRSFAFWDETRVSAPA